MLGLFESKRNRFVGIDFGTSAIKVIELSYKDQKPQLENYGWFDLSGILQPVDVRQQKFSSYEDKLKAALHNLLKKLNIKNNSVHVAIPGFSGLVVLIEFPNMKNDEISVEEVSISWEIINSKDENKDEQGVLKNKVDILLVAAPKKEIGKYSSLFEGTSLKMQSIELETFSITRALIGNEKGSFLIMDMGSRATNMILVENGSVIINRSIDMGGNDITNTIADSLNISKQRAEIFKKEGKDFINDKENSILIPVLELLGGEAKRIMTAYKEKNKTSKIDKFIISGGSCGLTGIEKYFQNMLRLEVSKGDPLKNINYDKKLAPNMEKIGSSFSVAIGLALRGIEEIRSKK
ncbi:MAG: Type IV pilus biogenesis ATPase PilM [Candidatus Moranbacteria bacterium GW2011_GWC2_45_10]|nr:MAG: Type IV pilus biogenesis ATPase PilM [Candidatus Moranbacteria bacterium GW2011_GWC2_45_10]